MASPSLVEAVVRELRQHGTLTELLGTSDGFAAWIFRWDLFATVQGSGTSAIVVSSRSGWTSPNRHNTQRFPRLQIEIYSDLDRTTALNPRARWAEHRAEEVFEEVDKILHVPQAGEISWGDDSDGRVRVVTSVRGAEPELAQVPDQDGVVRMTALYDVALG